ncbi:MULTISPECIES: TadE/TadG family type IV pilus assembly protein [Cupriavidus]|uniref:TadE-like protein n=1 Tax=Cupriavidus pinatubonensis (strain JMP 134 / LMG 1197) TaxID=264198 RepID=Q46Q32_CUPPJ|nr:MULTISPECIES: TadE/TadG family type IV pilus assembly protein [Cupriavidus]QYY27633.1 pilus assembly protein [Cupriavidus pinatubonensis]TPQ37782.1 pilus assembly protein [Cupriavidus pinatubonensis]
MRAQDEILWRRRCEGIAALEFAIVAPALVAIVIGIVYYGMVLALQQVLTLAAEEGARAALRYPSGASADNAAATQALRVNAAAATALSTLPTSLAALVAQTGVAQAVTCASASGNVCVRVTLNLPTTRILPSVPMVPVPATLSGSAMVQLSPDT